MKAKEYKKPSVLPLKGTIGVVPLAAAAVAGLSVGGAFAIGAAAGLMKDDHFVESRPVPLRKVEQFG